MPKFITHTTAGNQSLINITDKLYHKNSLLLSGFYKHFFIATLSQQKHVLKLEEKKTVCPEAIQMGGNMFKYLVGAQRSLTEAATLSSPDSDDYQTQDKAKPDENNNPIPKACILLT